MRSDLELNSLIESLRTKLEQRQRKSIDEVIENVGEAARQVGLSFSGSWLGYHSRVYYDELKPPPPGANFSQEWGLKRFHTDLGSRGDWREFDPETVKSAVLDIAGHPDLRPVLEFAAELEAKFQSAKSESLSILATELSGFEDQHLEGICSDIRELSIHDVSDVAERLNPGGRVITRDSLAAGQGAQLPPHLSAATKTLACKSAIEASEKLCDLMSQAASHISRRLNSRGELRANGSNVFIGHGGSEIWRALKDFIEDRLDLPTDEFNRVPVAGVPNAVRLLEMLNNAAIAFLVLTGEDETTDGKMHARQNVVHEAGLFQGRLGLTKAIVVLEDGCEQFGNIEGLGQIRFPKGRIEAAFEDIRRVLEREGVL